jgi:hypothetical protein
MEADKLRQITNKIKILKNDKNVDKEATLRNAESKNYTKEVISI